MNTQNWVIDYRGENRAIMYRVKETVVFKKSAYQEILIVDTHDFGRALFLDGIPQSSNLDEYIYHEALVHPALVANKNPRNIFIAGGGEGAILREVLKHSTVQRVDMCDIDDVMVDLARTHLYEWHLGAFDDPKVNLMNTDARSYLEHTDEKYDCVFIDMTDPLENSPAARLFTAEFFEIIKSRLNRGGVIAMQAEAADVTDYCSHISIIKTLQQKFSFVSSYQTWISFYGLAWGFVLASDEAPYSLETTSIERTLLNRGCKDVKFYDNTTHSHMFSLPKYIRDALNNPEIGFIITDSNLLVVE